MSLIVAGAGPGNVNLLTKEVIDQINICDVVVAFDRIANDIKILRNDVIKLNSIMEILSLPIADKKVLVLASGDPCFFSITEFLKKTEMPIDRVCTGISSMQYFMASMQMQWQNINFHSFHGRSPDFSKMKNQERFFILTDKKNNPNFISQELSKNNFIGKIYVGYNLSYDDECVEIYNIGDYIEVKSFLNTVLIENEIH